MDQIQCDHSGGGDGAGQSEITRSYRAAPLQLPALLHPQRPPCGVSRIMSLCTQEWDLPLSLARGPQSPSCSHHITETWALYLGDSGQPHCWGPRQRGYLFRQTVQDSQGSFMENRIILTGSAPSQLLTGQSG